MGVWSAKDVAYAGVIAAVYAVISIILAPISYGVYQIRVAEALTVLPFLYFPAVFGLFIGCLIANIFGGNGLQDIVFGSLLTLMAAYVTHLTAAIKSQKLGIALAPLAPILINAFGVSLYLAPITGMPYFFVVQMIGLGQVGACYGLGIPLLLFLLYRRPLLHQSR